MRSHYSSRIGIQPRNHETPLDERSSPSWRKCHDFLCSRPDLCRHCRPNWIKHHRERQSLHRQLPRLVRQTRNFQLFSLLSRCRSRSPSCRHDRDSQAFYSALTRAYQPSLRLLGYSSFVSAHLSHLHLISHSRHLYLLLVARST